MPFSLTQQPLTLPPSLPCLHRPHSSSDSLSFLCLIFLVPLSLIRVSHSAASHCRSTAEGKGKWRQSLGESWSSLISHSSDKTRNSQSLSKLLSCPCPPPTLPISAFPSVAPAALCYVICSPFYYPLNPPPQHSSESLPVLFLQQQEDWSVPLSVSVVGTPSV